MQKSNEYPMSDTTATSRPPSYIVADENPFSDRAYAHDNKPRPGRFKDLHDFLEVRGAFSGSPNYQNYSDVQFINPESGDIIHIIDGDETTQNPSSRLHQRVMLVVRHERSIPMTPKAMMCVPLCLHTRDLGQADEQHWDVQQAPASISKASRQSSARQSLLVNLEGDLHLKPGITVNLGELWHVEYDHILIDTIGRVSNGGGTLLAFQRIKELFNESLDVSIRRLNRLEGSKKTVRQDHPNAWTRRRR